MAQTRSRLPRAPRAFLVLALLASTLVPGCVDDDAPGFITSEQARSAADRAAARWDDDATLHVVVSEEADAASIEEMAEDAERLREKVRSERENGTMDDEEAADLLGQARVLRTIVAAGPDPPGDGRAAVWIFGYASGDGDSVYGVAVGAGGVLHASEEDEDDLEEFSAPLDSWELGSAAAAQAARDGDEAYAGLAGTANVTGVNLLFQGDEAPLWLLALEPHDGEDGAAVFVNADNGTIIPFSEVFGDLFPLLRESGSESGSFTAAVGVEQDTSFQLEMDGHRELLVRLDLTPPSPVPIEARLEAPDGRVETWSVGFAGAQDAPTASGSVTLRDVPAGTYEVTLSAALTARSGWTVSWCTDGLQDVTLPFVFDFDEPACSELDSGSAAQAPAPAARVPWRNAFPGRWLA